jgi:murein DD-endopeptidase MepM/ murein hydrolase activator NlpD
MKFTTLIVILITLTFNLPVSEGQVFAFLSKKKKKENLSYLDRKNKIALANLIIDKGQDGCEGQQKFDFSPKKSEVKNIRFVLLPDSSRIPASYLIDHGYFQVWDTKSVNPYHTEVKDFDQYQLIKTYEEGSGKPLQAVYPLTGKHHVTSAYGTRKWKFHHGVDLRVKMREPVRSCFDGVVRISKYDRYGYGHYVLIRHKNGLETLYGHLDESKVKPGQLIKAGQTIGLAGNTGRSSGPHLHFEVRYAGLDINPDQLFEWLKGDSIKNELVVSSNSFPEYKDFKKAIYHRIRRGDSLWLLARKYGTTIGRICKLNGISRTKVLRIGQRIRVR